MPGLCQACLHSSTLTPAWLQVSALPKGCEERLGGELTVWFRGAFPAPCTGGEAPKFCFLSSRPVALGPLGQSSSHSLLLHHPRQTSHAGPAQRLSSASAPFGPSISNPGPGIQGPACPPPRSQQRPLLSPACLPTPLFSLLLACGHGHNAPHLSQLSPGATFPSMVHPCLTMPPNQTMSSQPAGARLESTLT